MQDRIFYAICFGFIFGVFLRSFLAVNYYLVILFGLIAFALILFFTLISKNKWGIIAGVFILTFCLGIFRFHLADRPAPQAISMEGVIVDEPDIRENNQKLIIQTKETKILVTTNVGNNYRYGDGVVFKGKLEKPENFITDQGKDFDYINYLRKDGIFYVMSYPDIEIVSRGNGNKIKSALFFIKNEFLEKINLATRQPESLLIGGLILGEKASFSEDLRKSFIDTGTIHIVALLLAGVIMILINPFVLAYDVSFQLSFIATIALIFFTPKIEQYFLWVPKHFKLRDIVSVTFAVYIFVLPFILYKMGNLSLVALPANVLVLPFIPITMILGFLTGLLGVINYFLSIPFGYVSYLLLHCELGVINFFSQIPFASLIIPDFPFILTLLIYAYFIYKLFGRSIKNF